jgi:Lysyl oxidase
MGSSAGQLVMRKGMRVLSIGTCLGIMAFGVRALGTTGATNTALAAPQTKIITTAARSESAAGAAGPTIKLIVAQNVITVPKYGRGEVYFDPGIWVASLGEPFQLDVKRDGYTRPLTITQAIRTPFGTIRRPLPSWMLSGWNGLAHFIHITIRTPRGRIVGRSTLMFCPDGYNLSRTNPDSALTSNYPLQCSAGDPFSLGEVWGIARGWAVDPSQYTGYRLNYGTYRVTETIGPRYANWFHISARDAKATVKIKVVKAQVCCGPVGCCLPVPVPSGFIRERSAPAAGATPAHGVLPSLPAVPNLVHPPLAALPDLIPLPSWGISITHQGGDEDYLDFGATVWIAGHAPLDVEAFRSNGSDIMKAYQYFWLNGHLIGRARVGTMGFANYNSWHFQQFAQYRLLNAHMKVVVRSRKIGFCIAPTDGVDMLLRHATWQPEYTGIAGNCGSPTALWVQELLPLGWGDTYFQYVPYQSFDISTIPNGTYYIEIIANPEHLLHEVTMSNDTSLRKVILGGTPGHRTVKVPAWNGIDPEHE